MSSFFKTELHQKRCAQITQELAGATASVRVITSLTITPLSANKTKVTLLLEGNKKQKLIAEGLPEGSVAISKEQVLLGNYELYGEGQTYYADGLIGTVLPADSKIFIATDNAKNPVVCTLTSLIHDTKKLFIIPDGEGINVGNGGEEEEEPINNEDLI